MGIRQAAQEVSREGREELAMASPGQKAVLGMMACSLAFEWGTGNEALIGLVAGNVLRRTHNTLLTAAAGGGASFLEQSTFGLLAVASVHNFPRVMSNIRQRLETQPADVVATEVALPEARVHLAKRIGNRFLTAFAIGTSLGVMKDNAVKEHTKAENTKHVVMDAGLIGAGVAGIAAVAAGATNLGRSVGLSGETNVFVDIISSPFTYLGLFGVKSFFDYRNWRTKKNLRSKPTTAE